MVVVSILLGKMPVAGALNQPVSDASPDGKIDIIYGPELLEPYRERRSKWSFTFGLNQENFFPEKAQLNSDTTPVSYESLFGKEPIRLFQINTGAKYNFLWGALSAELIYGMGQVSDGRSGVSRVLSITKQGLSFGWTMDSLFREPYVAPYINGQVFEMSYADKGASIGDDTGITAPTTGMTVGLLIQLNAVDPTDTAMKANFEYGLNNTFLDLFLTQYNTSNSKDDPELQTSLNWGAGIKLEF